VLLAGGSGTRFWPASRAARPKQFLPLDGKTPLLVSTWRRALRLASPESIWVVAPAHLAKAVTAMLPDIDPANLVVEPSPRDTAPAITLACAAVADRFPDATVGVFPSDHVIRDSTRFVRAIRVAAAAAGEGALVCLGTRPNRPATGFGYLRCGEPPRTDRAVPVARFVEKPDAARAARFLKSGQYLWNAGMFLWRADRFLEEVRRTAPGIHRAVGRFFSGDENAWQRAPRASVDFAVMEKARNVRAVELDAGWDDVGSWEAAARVRGAAAPSTRNAVLIDSPGAEVFGSERLVAVVDLPDVLVVDTDDAILVVPRGSGQRVKDVVERLKKRGRKELL
jgi:mannose-1-phosphate guanylyltransferase/mannose-6-phosphate isomerase